MTKTDKLLIEFNYSKSDIHVTDEKMEEFVNNWAKKIITELQDVSSGLYFHGMALANIGVKSIIRQANVNGSFCSQCGKMKKEAYSEERIERCNCKK